MTVRLADNGVIQLADNCVLEDAEQLLSFLSADPHASVDWRGCKAAHAAVVQVLIMSGRPLAGPPLGEFLRRFVEPALAGGSA